MENTTKEKILDAALVSFAENGYKETNLRDLAAGMGLSKSALYKHYESKEDIWNALINRVDRYYCEHFGSPEQLPPAPASLDDFYQLAMNMVDFTIHDKQTILTRKILQQEQFRDEHTKSLATEHFLAGTKRMFAEIFRQMIATGLLRDGDPEMMALAFSAPITSLIHYCDREPANEPEILLQIEEYIRYFMKENRNEKDK